MSNEFLYPKAGPGLRDPFESGTKAKSHGRVLNPPRYAALGGLTSASVGVGGNDLKVRKPGGEK